MWGAEQAATVVETATPQHAHEAGTRDAAHYPLGQQAAQHAAHAAARAAARRRCSSCTGCVPP